MNHRSKKFQPKKHHKRPRVVYDTPGRECSHADKGCCPKCFDAMHPNHITRFPIGYPRTKTQGE